MYPQTALLAFLLFTMKANYLVSQETVNPFATILSGSEREKPYWHETNRRYVQAYLS